MSRPRDKRIAVVKNCLSSRAKTKRCTQQLRTELTTFGRLFGAEARQRWISEPLRISSPLETNRGELEPNRSAHPDSRWSVVLDHRACGRSPPATNTRAPYRLCSDGVGAETSCGDGVRRKVAVQVGWSALHRVFNRPKLKTKYFQKKKENTRSKSQCW